jgi:hypothetical protein
VFIAGWSQQQTRCCETSGKTNPLNKYFYLPFPRIETLNGVPADSIP